MGTNYALTVTPILTRILTLTLTLILIRILIRILTRIVILIRGWIHRSVAIRGGIHYGAPQ